MEVYEQDPGLRDAFSYASRETFDENLLSEIEHHTFTIYVIADSNRFEDLLNVVEVGAGLLRSGGLAVKIETTGVAYTKEEWNQLCTEQEYFPIYSHFVTLIGDENHYFSCGMKAFGLRDTVIPSSLPPEEAADLLNNVNLYSIVENPTFRSGETFSIGENTAVFNIVLTNDSRYDEEDVIYNPYGLLELTPV
ncbi:DUF4261 domain-containing protein [Bacillus sp. CHD6a]|uniref:DUF4261 domain-containing protein n=1 Tax=Bacillus sp. CHD6a TaxID=1643452 RepID=UPI000A742080|nr:DUF4261 domain-containing protein [Bacillus sp. CHD6a]